MITQELDHLTYHRRILTEEMPQARRLSTYILNNYKFNSLTDYGASLGTYLLPFAGHNKNLLGLELDEVAVKNKIHSSVQQCDLTKIINVNKSELAFCFEVAEHIEEDDCNTLLDNISEHTTDYIFWSAAQPGQGEGENSIGLGHVNCQTKLYWLKQWNKRNWNYSYVHTTQLINYLKEGYHLGWMINNLMVLRKPV